MSSLKPDLWQSRASMSLTSTTDDGDEFPPGASEWPAALSRRRFLELAGASLAFSSLNGCLRAPVEKIVPYIRSPQEQAASAILSYSTSCCLGGWANGLLVQNTLGRPLKVDGHPLHPANRGAASALHQALILSLYDPDRTKAVTYLHQESSWSDLIQSLKAIREKHKRQQGQGLYVLTELITSPFLKQQMSELKKIFPKINFIQYEAFSTQRQVLGTQSIFGKALHPIYRFDLAEVVISFDADFFASPLYPLRYVQDFMQTHRSYDAAKSSNSLYVVEPTPSLTGAWTPHRLALDSSEIPSLVQELHQRLINKSPQQILSASMESFLEKIMLRFRQKQGPALFLAGEQMPLIVHQLCHRLNFHFDQSTTDYIPTVLPAAENFAGLEQLTQDLHAGEVEDLLIIGGNPMYACPGSIDFTRALAKAKNSYHFSVLKNETSSQTHWFAALSHELESWGDALAYDGSPTLQQPLIQTLFDGKSISELLSYLQGVEPQPESQLKKFWRQQQNLDISWEDFLRKGVTSPLQKPQKPSLKKSVVTPRQPPFKKNQNQLEIIIRPDPFIWDGRFANNAWLQELPKPLSKITWENVALISPSLAQERKITDGQKIRLKTLQAEIEAPAWILPGQARNTVTLHTGYGRSHGGKVGTGLGYNAYPLWNHKLDVMLGELSVLSDKVKIACTQTHNSMNKTDVVKRQGRAEITPLLEKPASSLYPASPTAESPEAWAMIIDLDSCIGCSACTIACQSENNIPVVGKEGVLRGREMHWIRVDRYYSGSAENPRTFFQPVPCMHCEKAPCEPVCPVGATVHSTDGLNQMVYNRCVGTRYCSNNCPYKVRRFNFLSLNTSLSEISRLQKNPEVTVRPRGVMEKCTYCVQRINAARIKARRQNQPLVDGDVQTACQITCPTRAITFGNKNDPQSQIADLEKDPRHYVLLEELGTRPRTTYLAKIEDGGPPS